jgi:hypothetical protein
MDNVATLSNLNDVFAKFISSALVIIGIISVIMIVVGGINYIGAGGDKEGMSKAKGTFTFAIFGLILAISAWLILNVFGRFLGVDLSTFNICLNRGCP